jgi:hypothetical protein
MKRLSLIAGIAALLFLAPGIASAQGDRGGGFHGGGGSHATAAGGGWRGGRPYVAAGHAAYVAPHRGGYSVAPWGGGWRAHPYNSVGIGVRPTPRHVWVPGYWGYRGGTRVWIGGAWLLPQTNWVWIAPHWQWNGYSWVWAPGYSAPPY